MSCDRLLWVSVRKREKEEREWGPEVLGGFCLSCRDSLAGKKKFFLFSKAFNFEDCKYGAVYFRAFILKD